MATRDTTSTSQSQPVNSEFDSSLSASSTIKYENSTPSRSSATASQAQPISSVYPKISKTTVVRGLEPTTISEAHSQSDLKKFLEDNKLYLSIGAAGFVVCIVVIVVIILICCRCRRQKKKKENDQRKQIATSKLSSKKRNTEKGVRKSSSDIAIKPNIKSSQPQKSIEKVSNKSKKRKSIPVAKEQRSKGESKVGSKGVSKKKEQSSLVRTLTPTQQLNSRVQFDESKNLVVDDKLHKKKKLTSCRSSPNSSVAPLKSILKRRNSA